MNENRLTNGRGNSTSDSGRVSRETPDGEDVSTTVILVVEEITGTPMEELPLLERRIDIDALNELFEPRAAGDVTDATGTLEFEYAGCTITVDSEGRVVAQRSFHEEPNDTPRKGEAAGK